MSLRQQRVRELLKREIGEIIRRELPLSEAGLISINDVLMSSDLHSATVFVGVLGTTAQKQKAGSLLQKERGRIQGMLGRNVVLKYTPTLRFIVDDSIEKGNRVIELLDEIDRTLPPAESLKTESDETDERR
ncbi:MAG: 30S ribosome-binding factor RbfA [Verrucomicrobia bacterium]|nr:30S ribosome-binding factor RbfA [Verrucomicrobiota bacterium]